MSITVTELYPRRHDDDRSERKYRVVGSSDEAAIKSAVESAAPASVGTLTGRLVEVTELGADTWDAIVTYTKAERAAADFIEATGTTGVTFDAVLGPERIYQSLGTTIYTPAGKDPIDHRGAINVGSDGNVEGVDFPTGGSQITVTHYLASLTMSDISAALALRKKANNANFTINPDGFGSLTFGQYELLYMGLRINKRGYGDWEVQHVFLHSPNKSNILIKDRSGATVITVTSKAGWQYLWVYYGKIEEGGAVGTTPLCAYVEQLAELGNFSDLIW